MVARVAWISVCVWNSVLPLGGHTVRIVVGVQEAIDSILILIMVKTSIAVSVFMSRSDAVSVIVRVEAVGNPAVTVTGVG